MVRIFNLILLAAMIIGAAITYDMKHKAEKAAEHVAQMEHRIAREKEAVQLLRAEYAMLVQPDRLQAVVDRYPDYFKLQPFTPAQSATLAEIPMKPIGPASEEAIADIIAENKSAIR
jgi:hypothetical protein